MYQYCQKLMLIDTEEMCRCRRIYGLALPPLASGEAALVSLLLFMILPPMITQSVPTHTQHEAD